MKNYIENIPEWMMLLYDNCREEAYHELQRESQAFRYYESLSCKIQKESKTSALILEHAFIKKKHKFRKKELQGLSNLIECEFQMENLITQKIYWKAWRDCIRSLRMAGVIPAWEESYEETLSSIS